MINIYKRRLYFLNAFLKKQKLLKDILYNWENPLQSQWRQKLYVPNTNVFSEYVLECIEDEGKFIYFFQRCFCWEFTTHGFKAWCTKTKLWHEGLRKNSNYLHLEKMLIPV